MKSKSGKKGSEGMSRVMILNSVSVVELGAGNY